MVKNKIVLLYTYFNTWSKQPSLHSLITLLKRVLLKLGQTQLEDGFQSRNALLKLQNGTRVRAGWSDPTLTQPTTSFHLLCFSVGPSGARECPAPVHCLQGEEVRLQPDGQPGTTRQLQLTPAQYTIPGKAGRHPARPGGAAKGRCGRQEDWQPSPHWS